MAPNACPEGLTLALAIPICHAVTSHITNAHDKEFYNAVRTPLGPGASGINCDQVQQAYAHPKCECKFQTLALHCGQPTVLVSPSRELQTDQSAIARVGSPELH